MITKNQNQSTSTEMSPEEMYDNEVNGIIFGEMPNQHDTLLEYDDEDQVAQASELFEDQMEPNAPLSHQDSIVT